MSISLRIILQNNGNQPEMSSGKLLNKLKVVELKKELEERDQEITHW